MKILVNSSFSKVLNSFFKVFRDSELNLLASSLAFFTILAIVPFLAVSLSVVHFFGSLEKLAESRTLFLIKYLTVGSGEQIGAQIQSAITGISSEAFGVVSYLFLIAASIRLLKIVDQAVQRIWQIKKTNRSFIKFLFRLAFIFLAIPGIALGIGILISIAPNFFEKFSKEMWTFVIFFPVLFGIYKIIPNRKVDTISSLLSALITSIILSLGPLIYVWISSRFLSYNKVYGSLAFLPLFLIWVFVLWAIILFGVAFNVWLQSLRKSPRSI